MTYMLMETQMEVGVPEKTTLYTFIGTICYTQLLDCILMQFKEKVKFKGLMRYNRANSSHLMQIIRDVLTSLNICVNVFICKRAEVELLKLIFKNDLTRIHCVSSTFKQMCFSVPIHTTILRTAFSLIINCIFLY